eukprot:3410374-Pyramimonas_sp.AAC.1
MRRKGSFEASRPSSPTARRIGDELESLGGDRVGVPDTPPSSDGPEARLASELRRHAAHGRTGEGVGTGIGGFHTPAFDPPSPLPTSGAIPTASGGSPTGPDTPGRFRANRRWNNSAGPA